MVLADSGIANAYATTNASPLVAGDLTTGLIQQISISNANTGAATFAPDGLTAKPIYGLGLTALQGGELAANGVAVLMYLVAAGVNGGNGAWILLASMGGALQIGAATNSQHAIQAGQQQSNALTYGTDTGAANVYQVTYAPAITALKNGMVLEFEAKTANTGASTFSPNGLAAKPIIGGAHSALQGGEIVAGGKVEVMWHSALGSWALLGCTGGAMQVQAATQSQHAVALGQMQARTGSAGGLMYRNLLINAAGNVFQRPYTSGTATTSAGQYAIDKWKVATSGQNLSWASSGAYSIFTAPAGGVSQVIEGASIIGGTYVLSGKGRLQPPSMAPLLLMAEPLFFQLIPTQL
ncbi:hypothetical protein [Paludibacterium denitrificans]|uniref:Uncharacterized protein n=1 Tax=Paludibacterium denitrificans TaxID=2675226 RepID=A0A844GCC8_9NEIS|nr:hypothetical protein [Paludibacterium denitrificans]MTD32424.1 hypothetical protein [Paludibacterium denitrificans]